jgi:hypothetical protein
MNKLDLGEYEFALRVLSSNIHLYEYGRISSDEYQRRCSQPLRIIKSSRSQEGCSGFLLDSYIGVLKPRVSFSDLLVICKGHRVEGYGTSIKEAYDSWLNHLMLFYTD